MPSHEVGKPQSPPLQPADFWRGFRKTTMRKIWGALRVSVVYSEVAEGCCEVYDSEMLGLALKRYVEHAREIAKLYASVQKADAKIKELADAGK